MKDLSEFNLRGIKRVFTDIDDTLTDQGVLRPEAYKALWDLSDLGIQIIPITGRPAGWCEMIARFWPVDGVIGENGGFYFRYVNKHMKRVFVFGEEERNKNRKLLENIQDQILSEVSGAALASDQFCRLMDLAIDFCEDVRPLSQEHIDRIVEIFHAHGAQAKVSSIHVNGWFGSYDKLSMCKKFVENEYGLILDQELNRSVFCGDSPNDEPMFSYFPYSFGVANVNRFQDQMENLPTYVARSEGGRGFVQIAKAIMAAQSN